MLASTIQFSHNTPHKTTTREINTQAINLAWVIQPGNNAPDTQQCTKYLHKQTYVSVLVNPSHWLRCISTRLSFGGSETFVHINHQANENKYSQLYAPTGAQKIMLLRKEVIHPHLPVRVPCYDFVPIADPTFDSSLTSLGHWLRVLPTFMT